MSHNNWEPTAPPPPTTRVEPQTPPQVLHAYHHDAICRLAVDAVRAIQADPDYEPAAAILVLLHALADSAKDRAGLHAMVVDCRMRHPLPLFKVTP